MDEGFRTGRKVPDGEARQAARCVVGLLRELARALEAGRETPGFHWARDLSDLPRGGLRLLARTLGGGEVEMNLCRGEGTVEETGVRAVWMLHLGGRHSLVAALLPRAVQGILVQGGETDVAPETLPPDVPVAAAVLAEAREALGRLRETDPDDGTEDVASFVRGIDLLHQPFGPRDLTCLLSVIGHGGISVTLRGFAKSRIESTKVRGLWRSRIENREGRLLFDSLVIARIPPEVPAGPEDLPESVRQVRERADRLEREFLPEDLVRTTDGRKGNEGGAVMTGQMTGPDGTGGPASGVRERIRRARIGPATRMQCGVCWHVYDPASGDPEAGVPPGTGFPDLPAGWSCPGCGSPPERFLPAE